MNKARLSYSVAIELLRVVYYRSLCLCIAARCMQFVWLVSLLLILESGMNKDAFPHLEAHVKTLTKNL